MILLYLVKMQGLLSKVLMKQNMDPFQLRNTMEVLITLLPLFTTNHQNIYVAMIKIA